MSVSAKKAASPKHHPVYSDMVKSAIQTLKERKGSSRAAILKYILNNYTVGENIKMINSHLRATLVKGVKAGALKQMNGTGASGRFRVAELSKKPAGAAAKKPRPVPKKKPAAAPKSDADAKKAPVSRAPKPKSAVPKAKRASPKKAKAPLKKPKVSPKKNVVPKKVRVVSPAKATPVKKSKASPKKKVSKK